MLFVASFLSKYRRANEKWTPRPDEYFPRRESLLFLRNISDCYGRMFIHIGRILFLKENEKNLNFSASSSDASHGERN
jgi:hypothetical protein